MPTNLTDLADMLTVPQAAAELKVSRRTMERIIRDGSIEVVRVGAGRGMPRITRRALLDFLHRRTTRAS